MSKRKTPAELRAAKAVERLIKVRADLSAKAIRENLHRDITQQMADGIGVPRETLSRWVTRGRTPVGLSVSAIEAYCERIENQ